MLKDKITCNGHPVVMSLSLVTEPWRGWKGREFIGTYYSMKELNDAINKLEVPLYWMIEIEFEDEIDD